MSPDDLVVGLAAADATTVLIDGRSGAGKSTVVKLALRLLDPQTGRVTIDGEELNRTLQVIPDPGNR